MISTISHFKTEQVTKPNKVHHAWHLIDAKEQHLGRLATKVVGLLRGRGKVDWSPMQDVGDHVVVINAATVVLTGNKESQKNYYRHSTYPGHLRTVAYADLKKSNPTEVVRRAVYGMLPKNKLRQPQLKRLHIFADDKHTFTNRLKKD